MPPVPSRRGAIDSFLAMDLMREAFARKAAGERIVFMCVGEPGTPAPGPVRARAAEALAAGRLGYTDATGLPVLRAAIAGHYRAFHGVELDPARVVVTTGSSAGFDLAFLAAFDVGDRVAIASPGYPPYRNILSALGLEAVEIEVGPETRHVLTAEAVAKAHRERPLAGVLVASPANPTGTMMSAAALAAMVETCRELGIWLISDEIYHRLVWDGREATALAFGDDAIVLNSFSKYYSMTGWRIGWMVVPERLVRPIERLAQNLFISTPELAQIAAVEAFTAEATAELDVVKAGYARNRALLAERLPKLGFTDILPMDGAFYVYASVARLANDSEAFSRRMLAEAGVAATTGKDFDRARGHATMRFSYAGAEAEVREAVDRLEAWLG